MVKKERKRKRSSLKKDEETTNCNTVENKRDYQDKSFPTVKDLNDKATRAVAVTTTNGAMGETTRVFHELGLSISIEGNIIDRGDRSCYYDTLDTIPKPYVKSCLSESYRTNQNDHLLQLAKHSFYKMFSKKNYSSEKNTQWNPTSIQLQSWPILERKEPLNLIGLSPTGSGKSLSYIVPIVYKASSWIPISNQGHDLKRNIFALIITPTRELTVQVSKVVKIVCKSAKKLKEKYKDDSKNNVHINLTSLAIYGGIDKTEQIDALVRKNHTDDKDGSSIRSYENVIVTCTPGRLIDLLEINNIAVEDDTHDSYKMIQNIFRCPQMLIIDEADRVATQTDISQQVDTIIAFLTRNSSNNANIRVGIFSATLPVRASLKIDDWVSKPRVIIKVNSLTVGQERSNCSNDEVKKDEPIEENQSKISSKEDNQINHEENQDAVSSKSPKNSRRKPDGGLLNLSAIPSHVEQIIHVCANHKKPKKLMTTIHKIRNEEKKNPQRRRKGLVIVFFGRVKTLQYVHQLLKKEDVQCVQLHSQMKQERREFQLNQFRAGKCPILLATDIAARGIHVNNVEYIINYDFPGSLEQYVHRCGRAGRNKVTNELKNNESSNDTTSEKTASKATVYSFFHRELAAMAKDTIELLKSNNAFIDPNLLALVPEKDRPTDEPMSKSKRRRLQKANQSKNSAVEKMVEPSDFDQFDSDEEEFKSLLPNRIALKRASHVSDVEDSDDGDANDE